MLNQNEHVNTLDLLRRSYKKLKSCVFFDKTQLILRNKIVKFESENDMEHVLEELAFKLDSDDSQALSQIYASIDYVSFPKKIKSNTSENKKDATFITNICSKHTIVSELQYFIDMDVEGYILGIAWILSTGYLLDKQIYEHSYGNRLRRNLFDENKENTSYSPYLFEPYFQQYEGWRDHALEYAKKSLAKHQDIAIMTLDFKRFFYQVDVSSDALCQEIEIAAKEADVEYTNLMKNLTEFVGTVINNYSSKIKDEYDIGNRCVLPIGFHPSNIISNYCLKKFDDAIVNGWNPLYYGRYVDDIIIVEKVEKNSDIYKHAVEGTLDADGMISYYLLSSAAWKGSFTLQKERKTDGLLCTGDIESSNEKQNKTAPPDNNNQAEENGITYHVNKEFMTFPKSDVIVQNAKVKVFYFNSMQSDALLDCFQKELRSNKSEFRFLPEDEPVIQEDDYSEIYNLIEKDGPNKLRGVADVSIDKFKLSKFFGKMTRISGLVYDKREKHLEKSIEKIFDCNSIIDNYLTWEKIIEIYAINDNFDGIETFCKKVMDSIAVIETEDIKADLKKLQASLIDVLVSALCKSLSLVWGPNVVGLIAKLEQILRRSSGSNSLKQYPFTWMRENYLVTRMCDKYAIPILIDAYIENNVYVIDDSHSVNLSRFDEIKDLILKDVFSSDNTYAYHPYIVSISDLTIYYTLLSLKYPSCKRSISDLVEDYIKINYQVDAAKYKEIIPVFDTENKNRFPGHNVRSIKVGEEAKEKINIAIANTSLNDNDFEKAMKDKPNRSYKRYSDIVKLVNSAIANNADMLVMPESFVPFEWIPILARTCAKNQMALVTGVEHFKVSSVDSSGENSDSVYNLTAVILPYMEDSFKYSYIYFHRKTHMSPSEAETIQSYRCTPVEGKGYELFSWNDFWFSVYCCYELASIKDRSLFQSYVDAVVAVEWNKDTKYYSNIVESLSRDLHCFCIQVNTSKYGDSRITRPSKSEEIDIIKVKGGANPTVLIDELDITGLREFQYKGNLLQGKNARGFAYKQTPPDFNYEILKKKIDGTLWQDLSNG